MKALNRFILVAIVGVLAVAFDREGWPALVLLGTWVAMLVFLVLMAEWRKDARPLADFFVLMALGATLVVLMLWLVYLILQASWGSVGATAVFVLVVAKATYDFLNRPAPWDRIENRRSTLAATPREEIAGSLIDRDDLFG